MQITQLWCVARTAGRALGCKLRFVLVPSCPSIPPVSHLPADFLWRDSTLPSAQKVRSFLALLSVSSRPSRNSTQPHRLGFVIPARVTRLLRTKTHRTGLPHTPTESSTIRFSCIHPHCILSIAQITLYLFVVLSYNTSLIPSLAQQPSHEGWPFQRCAAQLHAQHSTLGSKGSSYIDPNGPVSPKAQSPPLLFSSLPLHPVHGNGRGCGSRLLVSSLSPMAMTPTRQ
jgi:hypothetical protein